MKEFSQQTLVPVGLVIALTSIVFSLGQSYSRLDAHEEKLGTHSVKIEMADNKLDNIMQTLARIEERLANRKK